jgi:hypothetical protein
MYEKKFGAKKAINQKKSSSVSARKLMFPSWLDSARRLFSSTQLRKLARTHHYFPSEDTNSKESDNKNLVKVAQAPCNYYFLLGHFIE